ncbi:MAG: Mfa1 fimbrilin C-terminal domain-containing protein [Muribaculaceae bacterium]|nr:Mfa1 fimbrilin C-terminal domain-containing protein [Muribaculaceae bacterium]
MKKSFALAFASGILLFGSCAGDAPEAPNPGPIDEEGNIGYIRIDFPGTTTRALETTAPNAKELEIENAAFVFYCDNGYNFTCYARKERRASDKAYWVEVEGDKHEGQRCAIVKLPQMPRSVAVIVNTERTNIGGDLNEDATPITKYCKGDNELFYMSSTRYWDEANNLSCETPISADKIYREESDAIKALDENGNINAVLINVEHYVAKVNVTHKYSDPKYKLDADGQLNPQAVKEEVEGAIVKFKPEYTFLTATSTKTTTIKKLPEFGLLATWVQNWKDLNDPVNRHSSWLRMEETPREVSWPTLNDLQTKKLPLGHKSVAYSSTEPFYAFDNRDDDYGRRTSVVVTGKYTVTDAAGKDLSYTEAMKNADIAAGKTPQEVGTFWLVAFQDKFTVYNNELDAIKAMGGEEGDQLEPDVTLPDGQNELKGRTDGAWTSWTGWMRISGKNFETRCIKYCGGYGYYAKPINHFTPANTSTNVSYDMVVRNHYYDVSITGIQGMGVGIPTPNDPIVPVIPPNPNDQNYWLHMSVKVLDWRNIVNDVEWQ